VGKKKDNDAAADFFGNDDLDWLEGESQAFKRPDGSEEPLKVAALDEEAAGGEEDAGWANTISPPLELGDNAEISDAPTLVFSSIDTLPPQEFPGLSDAASDDAASDDAASDDAASDDAASDDAASDDAASDDAASDEGTAEEEAATDVDEAAQETGEEEEENAADIPPVAAAEMPADAGAEAPTTEGSDLNPSVTLFGGEPDDSFDLPEDAAPPALDLGADGGADSLTPWDAFNPADYLADNPDLAEEIAGDNSAAEPEAESEESSDEAAEVAEAESEEAPIEAAEAVEDAASDEAAEASDEEAEASDEEAEAESEEAPEKAESAPDAKAVASLPTEFSAEQGIGEAGPSMPPMMITPELEDIALPRQVSDDAHLEAWREAVDILNAEAHHNSTRGSQYRYAASVIALDRLGDLDLASRLIGAVVPEEVNPVEVFELRSLLAAESGDWAGAIAAKTEEAEHRDPVGAAEAWRDIALVHAHQLGEGDAAIAALSKAVALEPTDVISWTYLRDFQASQDMGAERAQSAGILAELAGDTPLGAEALWEQGCVLAHSGESDGSRKAFEGALQRAPGDLPLVATLAASYLASEDFEALGDLYASQATGTGKKDGNWWWLMAARAYRQGEIREAADKAYVEATADGVVYALPEYQSWLLHTGRPLDAAESLQGLSVGSRRGAIEYLRGRLLELGGADIDAIVGCYREALAEDPDARPAEDALLRILRRAQRTDEMKRAIEAETGANKPASRLAVQWIQLGEALLDQGEYEGSVRCFEQVLETYDSGYRPAIDGLFLAAAAGGDHDKAAQALRCLANISSVQPLRADYLCLAGLVHLLADEQVEAAEGALNEALETQANHAISYSVRTWYGARTADWSAVAAAAAQCGDAAMQDEEKAALHYRAARLFYAESDYENANVNLDKCLDADSGFGLAKALRAQLAAEDNRSAEVCDYYRSQALRSEEASQVGWARLAAATWAIDRIDDSFHSDIAALFEAVPGHEGGQALSELAYLTSGNMAGLAGHYECLQQGNAGSASATYALRAAELRGRLGEYAACQAHLGSFAAEENDGRPVGVAAYIAASIGDWPLAVSLLGSSEDLAAKLQQARVIKDMLHQPQEALPIFQEVFNANEGSLAAALGLARVAHLGEDPSIAAEAHSRLAHMMAPGPYAVAHALWAGGLYATNNVFKEREHFQLALGYQPTSVKAYEGALSANVRLNDGDALIELVESYHPDRRRELAQDLERIGDDARASEIWSGLAKKNDLWGKICDERCLTRLQRWSEVFSAICTIRDHISDDDSKATLDRRRRDVLANLITDVDDSWTFYSHLHEEAPDDRGVQKSLSTLAGERKDANSRVHFLGLLSDSASEPLEAAAYQRDAADTLIAEENFELAKEAYYRALGFASDESVTLVSLKDLSERVADWPTVVDVLRRQVGLSAGDARVELQREAADIIEVNIGDGPGGIAAWQELLQNAPHDRAALSRLMALSEKEAEWSIYVESGRTLAENSEGAERSTLYRQIGIVSYDYLDINDAHRYLETAIGEENPDIQAAARLEVLHRDRGDWQSVERVLLLQAELDPEHGNRIQFLERAAQVNSEVRHDRDAAANVYNSLLEIEPGHVAALQFCCAYLFDTGSHEEALPLYQRLEPVIEQGLDLDDFDVRIELSEFYFSYAEILGELDRGLEALARYERVLQLNPTHLASLRAVAPLYFSAQEWKKAENAYRQLLQLTGGQGDRKSVAEMYTQLGLVERQIGNEAKAYKRFNKALEVVPNHVEALRGMALVLEDRKDWSTLLNVYNNVIYHATDPAEVTYAYLNKGRVLDLHMSRPDKAAQHYERSLAFEVRQPEAYLRLAELAMRRMDYKAAGEFADKGLAATGLTADLEGCLKLCKAAGRQFASDGAAAKNLLAEALEALPALAGTVDANNALADLDGIRKVVVDQLGVISID
jgi:tetratricopeptide (TPR) repeat protein